MSDPRTAQQILEAMLGALQMQVATLAADNEAKAAQIAQLQEQLGVLQGAIDEKAAP